MLRANKIKWVVNKRYTNEMKKAEREHLYNFNNCLCICCSVKNLFTNNKINKIGLCTVYTTHLCVSCSYDIKNKIITHSFMGLGSCCNEPKTWIGSVVYSGFRPHPSWPSLLEPIAMTVPDSSATKVWWRPHATAVTGSGFKTWILHRIHLNLVKWVYSQTSESS